MPRDVHTAQLRLSRLWLGAGGDVHDAGTWRAQLSVAVELSR